jgi:hypothetical protein
MEYNKTSAEQGLKDLRKEAKPKEEDKTYLTNILITRSFFRCIR